MEKNTKKIGFDIYETWFGWVTLWCDDASAFIRCVQRVSGCCCRWSFFFFWFCLVKSKDANNPSTGVWIFFFFTLFTHIIISFCIGIYLYFGNAHKLLTHTFNPTQIRFEFVREILLLCFDDYYHKVCYFSLSWVLVFSLYLVESLTGAESYGKSIESEYFPTAAWFIFCFFFFFFFASSLHTYFCWTGNFCRTCEIIYAYVRSNKREYRVIEHHKSLVNRKAHLIWSNYMARSIGRQNQS